MKKLPFETIEHVIEKYKASEGFDSNAVWNFLGTAHHCGTLANALKNLRMDEILYSWTFETRQAIFEGLFSR
jgi:hypothetical protein